MKFVMKQIRKIYAKIIRFIRFAKPKYFLNNSQNLDTACFILAGYQEYTWDIVFKRIEHFAPKNIDFCIVSSGVYSERLKKIAEQKNWSYIAMKQNSLTLALNSAIRAFPNAQHIYKIDEDIFITKGFFENVRAAFEKAKKDYTPGIAVPIIPIGYLTYRTVLEKLNLVEEYTRRFEYPKISFGDCHGITAKIWINPEVARFFWERGGQIDDLAKKFNEDKFSLCPARFNVGAMYFEREILAIAGHEYFPVRPGSVNMGGEETFLLNLATTYSRVIVVAENSLVGHLSTMNQKAIMKDFFQKHQEIFDIKES